MATKKGYKIVSLHTKGIMFKRQVLKSFVCGQPHALVYALDKVTERQSPNGPLAVFSSLTCARNWADFCSEHAAIYACEYEPSDETCLWYCWRNPHTIKLEKEEMPLQRLPEGTVLAESVKLIRKVR